MIARRTKLLIALLAVLLLPIGILSGALYASLPRRDGAVEIPGLTETVQIELDAHAVPRIRGATLDDVIAAQGFMHAEERYFQMDLTRRSAAGELAALVGARALPADRARRPYEFRRRAEELLQRLPERQRRWLAAYARGVNAGLADLGVAPPEYLLLRAAPEPWTPVDSLLVVLAFYTMLSNNEAYEKPQAAMAAHLPPEVYAFLTPSTARFDRPVIHGVDDPTGGYRPVPIPPADVFDARDVFSDGDGIVDPPLAGPASNQWAAGARRSARGDALLANDPHLRLSLPNVFYRTELNWEDHAARGVRIPGLPGILIGASERLAWGATVSNADQADWIVVETVPGDPDRYLTDAGAVTFGARSYALAVAHGTPEQIEVRTTEWGPVLDHDGLGRPLVLEATWLRADGSDLDILELMLADDVEAGIATVARWAGPSLNWMLADSAGAVAWAVNGPVPARNGFDGSAPQTRRDGKGWRGTVAMPYVGPSAETLFTANSRTLPREAAMRLSRMWMRPLRAERIDELLDNGAMLAEPALLTMQLDTRARAYDRIRELVLEVVPEQTSDLRRAWARRVALGWDGRADADSEAFRLLQTYYRLLLERTLAPLLAPVRAADPDFVYRWPLADEPFWRLLDERPTHLVSAEFADWPALLGATLDQALERLARDGLEQSWGRANRLDVAHPLAGVPVLGRWLRLPADEQAGSMVSLKVAAPTYGAVIRMGVAPTRPDLGYLEMAGGQSGHFLSRNFSDLYPDWAHGMPTPFLAGATESTIVLRRAP
jgi:penicillin G amidase